MKKNKRFSSIIAMLMAAVTVFLLLPLTVSAAGCNHVYGGTMWCEPTHPHEYFYYCENGCGEKLHLGDYATKSNCSICNSALTNCAHNTQWQDPMHPHEIVCQDCCMSLGTSSMYGCAECCPYHSGYTFYENQHQPGGYHNRYLYCYNCGSTIYQGVTYFLESCEICNPPVVSNVKLYASGDSASLSSSGIIEATKVPASFSVYAECENCYVTSLYYYNNGRKISTTGNSISYTATSYDEFQSLTFYVTTNTGVTDSISVNFNYARYVEAAVKWDYDGIIVRTITQNGQTVQSGLCTALDMDWNSSLTDSDYATISELVGAYDGKIYILTGSTLVRVYKPATGETLATFDTYDEFDALCNYVSWSSQTLSAFESARVNSLSYQAPRAVEGVAQWVTMEGTVLHTQTAAEASGYEFIKPSQSITVAYSASTYTPNGYTFKEMSWECGSDTGSSTSASSYSKTYTITTPPVNVTFVYQKTPTSGSLVVCAYDEDTLALISSATISCGGDLSTSNPASFSNLPFGTYYPSASASGYKSASGMITLSATNANREIDLFLSKNAGDVTVYVYDSETGWPISGAWISGAGAGSTNASGYCTFDNIPFGTALEFYASADGYSGSSGTAILSKTKQSDTVAIFLDPVPKTGNISVSVVNSETGKTISGALVTGCYQSGYTNYYGSVTFFDVLFGEYTISVSATGYYSNSGFAHIDQYSLSDSIIIYLTPIPTSGDITVYVKEKGTGSPIRGASVSGGGRSGTTNSSGYIKFADLDFGSYTFTASADGYVSGTASASISVTATDKTITIYLEEKKTDLLPDAIINGDIYKGSTIIVSAEVNNDGDIDLTPGKAATVTMTAKRNGGSVFDAQTTAVIIPANDTNLVWFTVDMPADGYTSSTVTFEFKVSAPADVKEISVSNNTDTISKTVVDLPNRNCADPGLELDTPSSFSYSKYSSINMPTRTWSVYEWNGGFVRKTYTAKLVMRASLVPDATAGYRKQSGGIWTTRSGYGLNTEVTVSVNGTTDTAGLLKVDTFYPEYNYSTAINKSARLELVSGKYVFKSNDNSVSGSRMHTTPLWFPDKAYAVKYYAYDLWCPGGMLYGYTNAYVNIDGDMYDDLYTN